MTHGKGPVKTKAHTPATIQLSLDDRDEACAIAPSGDVCQARHPTAWAGCRASIGVHAGKAYLSDITFTLTFI